MLCNVTSGFFMLRNIFLTGVLLLCGALPALAVPRAIFPTESEFLRYEYRLADFFYDSDTHRSDGVDIRKSDDDRRLDGQVTCGMLTEYSVREYLSIRVSIINKDYSNNPKRRADELAYLFGVTASAIDSLCTQNRAEFVDLVDELSK